MSAAAVPAARRRARATRGLRRWLLGGLAGAAMALLPHVLVPPASAAPADVASLHAAYVINFVRYTRWPEAPPASPLVIAVLGPGEVSGRIGRLARKAGPVEGHPLQVRRLSLNPVAPSRKEAVAALRNDLAGADVVYVAASHRSWNEAVIAAVQGQPVLTVGTGTRFVSAGGMFGLVQDKGHVHIAANEAVVRQAPLDVSARVLLLARSTSTQAR